MTDLPALREAVASILGDGRWEADGGRVYLQTDQAGYPVLDTGKEDAAAIVALRNAAPALLDEVERLRQGIRAWEDKEAHEAMSCYLDNEQLKADLAAARAERDEANALVDDLRAAGTRMNATCIAARAVLQDAKQHDSDITFAAPNVWIQVDRAAWLAWQERQR
jgi:hypothetical protein